MYWCNHPSLQQREFVIFNHDATPAAERNGNHTALREHREHILSAGSKLFVREATFHKIERDVLDTNAMMKIVILHVEVLQHV